MRKLAILFAVSAFGLAGAAHAASFAEIDANGDGVIDAEEFAAAYPDAGADAMTAADLNGDGLLSSEEHVAAVEAGVLPAQ